MKTLTHGRFRLQDGARTYPGYYVDGYLWNGWHQPAFTANVLRHFLNDSVADGSFTDVRKVKGTDTFVVQIVGSDDLLEFKPETHRIGKRLVTMYFMDGLTFTKV